MVVEQNKGFHQKLRQPVPKHFASLHFTFYISVSLHFSINAITKCWFQRYHDFRLGYTTHFCNNYTLHSKVPQICGSCGGGKSREPPKTTSACTPTQPPSSSQGGTVKVVLLTLFAEKTAQVSARILLTRQRLKGIIKSAQWL